MAKHIRSFLFGYLCRWWFCTHSYVKLVPISWSYINTKWGLIWLKAVSGEALVCGDLITHSYVKLVPSFRELVVIFKTAWISFEVPLRQGLNITIILQLGRKLMFTLTIKSQMERKLNSLSVGDVWKMFFGGLRFSLEPECAMDWFDPRLCLVNLCTWGNIHYRSLWIAGMQSTLQLSAMDVSARTTMKDAVKCDNHSELQNSENQQIFERITCFLGNSGKHTYFRVLAYP